MPVALLLYPEWVGRGLDSQRAFIVKYSMEEDRDLSYHFDNAEVTLNICLGKNFQGGRLYFGPMKGVNWVLFWSVTRNILPHAVVSQHLNRGSVNVSSTSILHRFVLAHTD